MPEQLIICLNFSYQSLGLIALSVLFVLLANHRFFKSIKIAFHFLAVIFLVRFLIFQLPVFWSAAAKYSLLPTTLRGRPSQIAKIQYDRYCNNDDVKYFAFGNSQMGFIFAHETLEEYPEYYNYYLPGLRISEYNFSADVIKAFNPEYLILHLSDKTLAVPSDIVPLRYQKTTWKGLYSLYRFYKEKSIPFENYDFIHTAIGELFPEYKYQHYFREAFRYYIIEGNDWVEKPKKTDNIEDLEVPASDQRVQRLSRRKRLHFTKENLDINMFLIEKFIRDMRDSDIEVVIFEGHYHPAVYNANQDITNETRARLNKLSKDIEGVHFISRKLLPPIRAKDYRDETHLKESMAKKLFLTINQHMKNISRN